MRELLNRIVAVEVSDTTKFNSSNTACNIKIKNQRSIKTVGSICNHNQQSFYFRSTVSGYLIFS